MTAAIRQPRTLPPAPAPAKATALRLGEHNVVIPASAFTLAGFREWTTSDDFPERGQFSFLGDEVFIDMSPEEIETHSKLKVELGRVLPNLVEKDDLGEFYG